MAQTTKLKGQSDDIDDWELETTMTVKFKENIITHRNNNFLLTKHKGSFW